MWRKRRVDRDPRGDRWWRDHGAGSAPGRPGRPACGRGGRHARRGDLGHLGRRHTAVAVRRHAMERKAAVLWKGNPTDLVGPELKVGDKAPVEYTVTANDMSPVRGSD